MCGAGIATLKHDGLTFIEPAKPTLVAKPPEGPWMHEVKFDGYRTELVIEDGKTTAYTIRGADWTDRYGPIAASAASLICQSAILDGEVYLPDEAGAADFEHFRRAMRWHPEQLVYVVFDCLYLNGRDLRSEPLEERRRLARELVAGVTAANLVFSIEIEGVSGAEAFAAAEKMNLEGIVSKRRGSRYKSGTTRDWLKTKAYMEEVLTVIGATTTQVRQNPKLIVARENGTLRPLGEVSFEPTEQERQVFWQWVGQHRLDRPIVAVRKSYGEVAWVEPSLRVRVRHLRGEERLRHATFIAFDLR